MTQTQQSPAVAADAPAQAGLVLGTLIIVAVQYPQYANLITAAAKTAFLAGDQYAHLAGIIAVLSGAALAEAAQ
jgi:hypothetical protein